MKNLETLNQAEKEMLLKFPAYISLLAANNDEKLDETERKSAIRFSHIKTFSCNPLLSEFYQQADQVFENNITELNSKLPEGRMERENAIKNALAKLESILKKLGKDYASAMHLSMNTFKDHVSKAHRSVLERFIFPVPIKGIND
ncbi:MAG: hypothetical protein ABIT08_14660 [Bacteroidia bacterium]